MKNSYNITQSEAGNWLYKADHHYLAARLLFLHGLIFSAEENGAQALEYLLKCTCKVKKIPFLGLKHKLNSLWKLAGLPMILDEGYVEYLEKLQKVLYSKHPDNWNEGRKGSDDYDKLDFLYLKMRNHVVELIPDNERLKTELDLAKDGEQMIINVIDRHGSWSLSEILKRSNMRYDLL
jgi:HEPN domain-containing protein